jgi:hypothetical protein
VIKSIIGGAAVAALLVGPALSAPTPKHIAIPPPKAAALSWVVTPTETGCRADLELVARSGAVTPVSLISDGQLVSLRFFKPDLPARAFLPIRVDRQRYSNLMLRGTDGAGELVLSQETEAAMRKGGTLGIAWLTEEPLQAPLAGSEQGLVDLRVCGAQTASRHRERAAADQSARDRAQADARAKAVTDAQLAAIQAQTAAADAQRRTAEETAERQRRADAEVAERQAALDDQAVQNRAYQEARRRAYEPQPYAAQPYPAQSYPAQPYGAQPYATQPYDDEDDEPRWAPPPPPRPYYPYPAARWRYQRY